MGLWMFLSLGAFQKQNHPKNKMVVYLMPCTIFNIFYDTGELHFNYWNKIQVA